MPIDFIPSPPSNGLHLGPLFIHAYGLVYVAAVLAAVAIASRRWEARGGDRALVREVALWGFPAGIVGGRLYFLATSWDQAPHAWWGPFAVWKGGLGIWGGVAAGTLAGVWILRRRRADIPAFLDAAAPALLVAQAIGRLGNYFNQELFGAPTTLPWGLEISAAHRPPGYAAHATFQPTFLYELIWNLALAGLLVWLGRRRAVRAPGLFALYVSGYSLARIGEELLRVDPAHHIFGLRLNFYVASALFVAGAGWFLHTQWRLPFPIGLKRRRAALLTTGVLLCPMAACAGTAHRKAGAPPRAAQGAARPHFGDRGLLPDQLSGEVVSILRDRVSRRAWPRTDFSRHLVPLGDFLPGGPPRDGIAPLDLPSVVSEEAANRYLGEQEPVLALALAGHARAYPIRIMLWHEIANDVLGGRPVAATYCPLCNSGEAFDRRLAGRTLRLGTTGLLRRSDLVMWDSASESWWQQFSGLALVGRYAGKRLRMLPAEMLSWSDFKRRYPRGDVLAQATGYERPYGKTPYPGYDTGSGPFGFNGERIDRRLPPMERVLAVRAAGGALAAPYSLLRRQPVVETYVGRVPALILYEQGVLSPLDASSIDESRDVGTAVAYDRRLGRRTLSFEDVAGRVLDRQTHSAWDTSGLSVSGPLRGHELRPLLQNSQFWFALAAFDPSIRILRAG